MRSLIFVLLTVYVLGSVTAKSLESKSLLDTILGHHGCQNGIGMVNCFVDPCMVSSCSNTAAVCVSNYCGGCHAIWQDVNGIAVTC